MASISPDIIRNPFIGTNGNWYVWDSSAYNFVDTGISATSGYSILYTPQTITDEQKAQARENIDAQAIITTSVLSTGGLVSGGVVTAQGTPDQTVAVSACVLITPEGKYYSVGANATIAASAADATNPRIDIVYITSAGALTYLAGTAAATPSRPATPANGTLLASIARAANDNTIAAGDITDMRKIIIPQDMSVKIYPNGTDDTASFRAAINNGFSIILTDGVYNITEALSISQKLKISGNGSESSKLYFTGCNGFVVTSDQVTLEGFGCYTNGTTYTAIQITEGANIRLCNLYFGGQTEFTNYWVKSIKLIDVWYSEFSDINIDGGNISNVFYGDGIYCDYSVNNKFSGIVGRGYLDNLFYFSSEVSGGGYYCEGAVIEGCRSVQCNTSVKILAGNHFNIFGNIFDMSRYYCVHSAAMNVHIENNWLNVRDDISHGAAVAVVSTGNNCKVIGNTVNISTAGYDGIDVSGYYVVVTNNTVLSFSHYGIYAHSVTDGLCEHNIFAGIGVYDIYNAAERFIVRNNSWYANIYNAYPLIPSRKARWTTIVTLTGGATEEYVTVPIPAGLRVFGSKPLAFMQMCTAYYQCTLLYDDANTTSAQLYFLVFHSGTISSGNVRVIIDISTDDSAVVMSNPMN